MSVNKDLLPNPNTPPASGLYVNQVGGSHYQAEFQHWDLVAATRIDYFKATITKYVTRAYKKNGRQDVEKAITYSKKAIALTNYGRHRIDHRTLVSRLLGRITRNGFSREFVAMAEFVESNRHLTNDQRAIIMLTLTATDVEAMRTVQLRLEQLLNDPDLQSTQTAV